MDVVIPAFNEEQSIPLVLADIPAHIVRHVVVCDNTSTDGTGKVARDSGAIVVREDEKGYGAACLKAIDKCRHFQPRADILAFMDADYSDHPEELPKVLDPIIKGEAELVIGSRALGKRQQGAMQPQQIFGNWLATWLMRVFLGGRFTDLGPFRAITFDAYDRLDMRDRNFGWTVEMQVKALRKNLRYTEVPVSYRKRVGVSKVTGTLKGSVMAGYKILYTIFKYLRS